MTKRILTIAGLMTALATPALAVPIDPLNVRPTTLAASSNLLNLVDTIFGDPTHSTPDPQQPVGVFRATAANLVTPILRFEYSSNSTFNEIGIWTAHDTTGPINMVRIFSGGASASSSMGADLSWNGNVLTITAGKNNVNGCSTGRVNCGSFANLINPNFFGFYVSGPGGISYSSDQLNGGQARMLAFVSPFNSSTWVLGFDDGTHPTNDFNDAVLKVEEVRAVPEPGSMMLLGTGLLGAATVLRRRFRK